LENLQKYFNSTSTGISNYPDIRLFLVFGIRPDIRQVKFGIRLDIGYQKRLDYPAGYPVHS
jgi:hypothetical protein